MIAAVLLFVALPLEAGGLAWRVTSASGAEMYLVGTVHAARPDFYPLPEPLTAAFDAADALVLELDVTAVEPRAAARFARAHGTLREGRTLEQLLGRDDWKRVYEWARRLGVPDRRLSRMQPWLAAVTLVSLQIQQLGLDRQLGMEMHFAARAAERGVPIIELETLTEQLSALSNLSLPTQVAFLEQSLTSVEEFEAAVNDIVDSWTRGDEAAMATILEDAYGEAEEVYAAVMVDRNHRWMPALERMLDSRDTHFVAVGALHLVGDDGLVALLAQRGYRVERL